MTWATLFLTNRKSVGKAECGFNVFSSRANKVGAARAVIGQNAAH